MEISREELEVLEFAVRQGGRWVESAPASGIPQRLIQKGLMVEIERKRVHHFDNGIFQVTQAGMEAVSKLVPPAEW